MRCGVWCVVCGVVVVVVVVVVIVVAVVVVLVLVLVLALLLSVVVMLHADADADRVRELVRLPAGPSGRDAPLESGLSARRAQTQQVTPSAGAMGGRPSLPGARTRSRATSRSW